MVTALVSGVYAYSCAQEQNKILAAHLSNEVKELEDKLQTLVDNPIQAYHNDAKLNYYIDWEKFYKQIKNPQLSQKLLSFYKKGKVSIAVCALALGATCYFHYSRRFVSYEKK